MVVTRSQADAEEVLARQREEDLRQQRIEEERRRRLALGPPASPSTQLGMESRVGATIDAPPSAPRLKPGNLPRTGSPGGSVRSHRSTASARARLELEAAEKLAELKKKELEIEAELIRKRLATELTAIQEDQESVHEDVPIETHHRRVDEWLQANPVMPRTEPEESRTRSREDRHLRFELHGRSDTPTRTSRIDQLTEAMERLARPRIRCADLPTFSGAHGEWLTFKAAYTDSTKLYSISAIENIQRLRKSLTGEARDIVAALLATATDPDVILRTLEQSFGRPEVIIDKAFEDLKKLPRPGSSAVELNKFAIRVQNVVCVLQNIDQRGYLYNPALVREILNKLSPHVQARWCDYATDYGIAAEPDIITLSRFLMREADRALKHAYVPDSGTTTQAKKETRPTPAPANKKKTNAVFNVTESSESKEQLDQCPKCEKAHELPRCAQYKALTVEERWNFVKEKGLCFKCLVKRHRRNRCKSKLCGVNECRIAHHATLHSEKPKQDEKPPTTSSPTEAVLSVVTQSSAEPRAVLLKMCPVTVVGPGGEAKTHALLDEGATISLIDADLARKIGARGPPQRLLMRGVNMQQSEERSQLVTVKIKGPEGAPHELKARTIRSMKLHQQAIPASLLEYEHLRDLGENEVCYESTRPGILVGTDHWEYIVSRELRLGKRGQPVASRTSLGWVIHGTLPRSIIRRSESDVLHVFTSEQTESERLHDLVDHHFKIDALGVSHKPKVSDAERRAVRIVESTLKRTDKGYEVGLPWKEDNVTLPPSYNSALRRLKKIEEKMDNDQDFAEAYTKQIDNLLQKGYAAPCDGTEATSPVCWYLPHFAVHNPNKPGKQRLVFDAAAKSRGVSLNDNLLEGPDLLMSLQGIMFRFREKPIAITADIQEMFLQVKIRPEDQPAQQFLWRGRNRDIPPRHYKMTSMIFGATSSPFMAHYVRDANAKAHADTHAAAFEAITRSHYMDDLAASYENEEEAQRAVSELMTVHAAAGFKLRGWNTNQASVLRDVPAELRATSPTPLGGDGPENKILGLIWNAEQDELGFNTSMNRVPTEVINRTRAPTKREALSAVMSIYDPLGLLSHFTIRAKIVLQSLWRLRMSWDEPIPEEENELFAAWLERLNDLAYLRLERCYMLNEAQDLQLHVLCDASEQAYAAVAYWRIIQPDGSVRLCLVAAKSKVAPRRTQTIPRLELQAAVIGSRLAATIKQEHRVKINKTVYWTDSTTVIHWVRNDERRYTPFVAHRLGEISELTNSKEWRWVPTEQNVADDATRVTYLPITADDRWFQGPEFLLQPEERWPADKTQPVEDFEVLHVSEKSEVHHAWLPDPARFSNYNRYVRAAAYVLAFVDKCRRLTKHLGTTHIERAENAIISRAQHESFGEDIERLQTARPISKASRLYKLDPILEDGLLRVKGRIGAATAPIEAKKPLILDGRHCVTKLIVMREHRAAGHAGRERVTNDLRQRYWIIHLRPTVRTIERDCGLCRRRRARPQPPATGDLPRERLEPYQRPFTHCGLDYFGPMVVKLGRRREKRWGALFTCLTSRAVHLEIVASLTTSSAIMALRRMAARRGWPRTIYSDNATNFHGADKELKAAYEEWMPALRDLGQLHAVNWRYIPPGAPNQGGAWERLVRSVKVALSATLNEKEPTEEVLGTLLAEAEFSINARPLTHVSVNPEDPEALTPNHFLLGSSMGLPSTGPCQYADRRTWRSCQALADHFWSRWVREYLPTLVPRGEPSSQRRHLQIGDIVVIVDHVLPRNVWPMGEVTRTYTGPDGGIRMADVRTKTGVFKRPVSKIVVLEKAVPQTAALGGELSSTPSHAA